ncbi:MAG: DinB family protein [Gemmobacter sp.]|nr:DinB family protein [Gemmobacter sp.]
MIAPDYCLTMARYNRWQNRAVIVAAETLDAVARRKARGAFWGSISGTLSHLLWGDLVWMSRFDGGPRPAVGMADSAAAWDDWDDWRRDRQDADARIVEWARRLTVAELSGDLYWYSGLQGRSVSRPKALCVAHFFNHQTHHRGQVHAMLTAAGARPGDTDLFLMPDEADWM